MFYRIVWLLVVLSSLFAMAATFITIGATQGMFFLLHIVLFIPGGIISILHWMIKGDGFWGHNKALTFIFAAIPAVLSAYISYLAITGQINF